ncbi:MAG: ABC transporter ATP-binding protein [Candidatus Cloacimonetes bacterium]|nr:ABC transporter ATP-binding protein [Candidatus Cloacimonadota bacterium]
MTTAIDTYNIDNLSFQYPFSDRKLTWPNAIDIRKGDIILLTGTSGTGKSTLLYILKGLIPEIIHGRLQGKINYCGKPLGQLGALEKARIGLLFQNPAAQMINRTVIQELALGLENQGLSSSMINEKINAISDEFAIGELLQRETRLLSGGEKQKVALISILLMDPDVLLFDEPTSFLDPEAAGQFITNFRKIATDRTLLIIEHNLKFLKNYVNRVLQIDASGRIIEIAPEAVTWQPDYYPIPEITPGSEILRIENLDFNYGKNPLLVNLDLTLGKGEVVGITGNNGSGKTTLLKIIAGLIRPQRGKIILDRKKFADYTVKQRFRKIAMLYQNPENHFLFSTVEKELGENNEYLSMVADTNSRGRNPFTLSEGEKRRLSLAIIWSLDRDLYLLDEPSFGQDENSRNRLLQMIMQMRLQQKSFIITSHDLPFLRAASDRLLKIEQCHLQNYQD